MVCSPYTMVGADDCPLFVPLQVQSELRMGLRKRLIDHKVYFPIHWPVSSLHRMNDVSQEIYNTELSFVCDQRYGKEDIIRSINIIRSF